uniref:NADH-ubiquinone oxidoreductase chain 4 n=1 Tax=Cryptobatrachus sp. TNHC-GDC 451 TaxID=1338817 RepID=S4V1M1_9NEOB|nr:NADH dehydrogenase subunit 4 [Cryptobatrachus sp. TNHC-GDC 451]
MLIIFMSFFTLLLSIWLVDIKRLWEVTITQAFVIATMSLTWLCTQKLPVVMNTYFSIDEISSPLLVLTCWLTAPTLLASQSLVSKQPAPRQRTYIFTIIALQITTLFAFMANNMMLFFVMFETTMIPTLIIITRWGVQKERMLAGTYFLFYTLFGSVALLTALLFFHETFGTLSVSMIKELHTNMPPTPVTKMWWVASLLAFLIKMPLYGLHLWLPKAHVEAPIAGSMILAGTLLKLGGYGILRISSMMPDTLLSMATPFIIFSMLGTLLSAMLCARQTDLKSMIAFSSVSHMGLVIAASMIKTQPSINGAMALMISHGLVSSALFCLANTSYERTHTRTLMLIQGSQIILPLASAWWLLATLLNMAIPPTINFMAEMMILSALFHWSTFSVILTGLSVIFTTIYSLYMFWSSQREHLPPHTKLITPLQTREHILLALHIIPALMLALKPSLLLF